MTEAQPAKLNDAAQIKALALAGNARLTLVSKATGTRFTYRIRKADPEKPGPAAFFVSVLTGPDNTADYKYTGFLTEALEFRSGPRGQWGKPNYKAFRWSWGKILAGELPQDLEVWHEGKCCRCGRALTDPVSIKRGLGPECATK